MSAAAKVFAAQELPPLSDAATDESLYRAGRRVFWNVQDSDTALLIRPRKEHYDELVIGVDPEGIAATINHYLMDQPTLSRVPNAVPVETSIAVIADDVAIGALVMSRLENAGYTPIVWAQAAGAWAMVRREQPAMVVINLNREHPAGGRMLAELLRRDLTTAHIPMLVWLPQQHQPEELDRLQAIGVDVLSSPITLDYLVTRVSSAISA